MTIHKEGHTLLGKLFVLCTASIYGAVQFLNEWPISQKFIVALSIFLFLIVLQFFRSPNKKTVINANHIIAPADGKVVVIEEVVETEYFNDKRKQISIFMSPINVHVNRNPVSGIVKYFKYHPGKYLVAWHPKSSTDNERTTLVVETNEGTPILFRQIAGALARRICWYVNENDSVVQGEEFGFIKFGSRIDVFLPTDAKILVDLEQKMVGGETVIAHLA